MPGRDFPQRVGGIRIPKQRFNQGPGPLGVEKGVFELYKQKTGKHVDELPQEQIKLAEKGFVGKKLSCLASEVETPPNPGEHKNGGRTPESTLLLSQLPDDE